MHFEAVASRKQVAPAVFELEDKESSRLTYASECTTVENETVGHRHWIEEAENAEQEGTPSSILKCSVTSVYKGSFDIVREELRISRQIGEGEFGLVLKGVHRGRPCAVKMLKQGVRRDTLQYQCLLLELSILASIRPHANVVGFLGGCIDDLSRPLIIEEFVDGQNLEEYLAAKRDGFNLGQPKVRTMLVNKIGPGSRSCQTTLPRKGANLF